MNRNREIGGLGDFMIGGLGAKRRTPCFIDGASVADEEASLVDGGDLSFPEAAPDPVEPGSHRREAPSNSVDLDADAVEVNSHFVERNTNAV
jgi:hypothetical protein